MTAVPSDDRSVPSPRPGLTASRWVVALAVLVVVSLAVAGIALARTPGAAAASPAPGTITVTGTGTIEGRPDTVQFSVGIHSSAYLATEALDENNAQIARLILRFTRLGIPKKDLQTTNVNVYEETDRYGTFSGFGVDDDLEVTVSSTSTAPSSTTGFTKIAGRAIDAAVALVGGGISFNGVSFSLANQSALLASARARAMQDAHAAASQLAAGGHESLGPIVKVTVDESQQVFYSVDHGYESDLNATAAGVPLEQGEEPVSVDVTVVYSLNG